MALESAQYVNQLNSTNPLSTDTVSQADDHLRLIKQVLVNTFPNLNAPVTSTAAQLNSPVPPGLIAMWSGAINAIPTGWFLCNGQNGTPDLRDRFIVGAGTTYAIGATGGANTVTLTEAQMPSHTHTITATGTSASAGDHTHTIVDPGHVHAMGNAAFFNQGVPLASSVGGNNLGIFNNSFSAVTGISINAAGAHTHVISVTATAATTGGGQAHENRPPYFALAYIMKA